MKRSGVAVTIAVLTSLALAGCGGQARSEPARGAETKVMTAPAAQPDRAADCAQLEKILRGFTPPKEEQISGAELTRSFGALAKALREMKATTPEAHDISNSTAAFYEKLAANGAPLAKAHAALAAAAETVRTTNDSYGNDQTGVGASCDIQKSAAADCTRLAKVLMNAPMLRPRDAHDPSEIIDKLHAFRAQLDSTPIKNGPVKHMVSVLAEDASGLEAALSRVKTAQDEVEKHLLSTEMGAVDAKVERLCPPSSASKP